MWQHLLSVLPPHPPKNHPSIWAPVILTAAGQGPQEASGIPPWAPCQKLLDGLGTCSLWTSVGHEVRPTVACSSAPWDLQVLPKY